MTDTSAEPPCILVVEDEAVVRMLLVETLQDLGFRVEAAGSAAEAQERLQALAGQVDAAIIDVGLPDRRGDTLAADLRALYAGLPIVIGTGYDEGPLRDRFRDDRRMAFLAKPYNTLDVVPVLVSLGVRDPQA